jgi:TctA family transporter
MRTTARPRPGYERWTIITGLIGLAAIFAPTTVFLLFALLPTIATAVLEQNPQRSATIAVGATNLAGAVPGLLHLWARANSMDGAIALLNDPASWGWAHLGAMVGILLAVGLPRVVASIMAGRLQQRIAELEQHQKQLAAQWGLDTHDDA